IIDYNTIKYQLIFIDKINFKQQVIHLNKALSSLGGVIANNEGEIQAIWASYSTTTTKSASQTFELFRGYSIELLMDIIEPFRKGEIPQYRNLEVEFIPMAISNAKNLG